MKLGRLFNKHKPQFAQDRFKSYTWDSKEKKKKKKKSCSTITIHNILIIKLNGIWYFFKNNEPLKQFSFFLFSQKFHAKF